MEHKHTRTIFPVSMDVTSEFDLIFVHRDIKPHENRVASERQTRAAVHGNCSKAFVDLPREDIQSFAPRHITEKLI